MGKPVVTPDDQLIVLPPDTPKGWRIYSVQPDATDERMKSAARELTERGLSHDWWIQGRGVFVVDCRADYDDYVIAAIEAGWGQRRKNPGQGRVSPHGP